MPRKAQHPSIRDTKKHVRQLDRRVAANAKRLQGMEGQVRELGKSLRAHERNNRRHRGGGSDVYTPMSKDELARQGDSLNRVQIIGRQLQRYQDSTEELHDVVTKYHAQITALQKEMAEKEASIATQSRMIDHLRSEYRACQGQLDEHLAYLM